AISSGSTWAQKAAGSSWRRTSIRRSYVTVSPGRRANGPRGRYFGTSRRRRGEGHEREHVERSEAPAADRRLGAGVDPGRLLTVLLGGRVQDPAVHHVPGADRPEHHERQGPAGAGAVALRHVLPAVPAAGAAP